MNKDEKKEVMYQHFCSSPLVKLFPGMVKGTRDEVIRRHSLVASLGILILAVFAVSSALQPPTKFKLQEAGIIKTTHFHNGGFLFGSKTTIEVGPSSYVVEGPASGITGREAYLRTNEKTGQRFLCMDDSGSSCLKVVGSL